MLLGQLCLLKVYEIYLNCKSKENRTINEKGKYSPFLIFETGAMNFSFLDEFVKKCMYVSNMYSLIVDERRVTQTEIFFQNIDNGEKHQDHFMPYGIDN